jgi:hypothetical protein
MNELLFIDDRLSAVLLGELLLHGVGAQAPPRGRRTATAWADRRSAQTKRKERAPFPDMLLRSRQFKEMIDKREMQRCQMTSMTG